MSDTSFAWREAAAPFVFRRQVRKCPHGIAQAEICHGVGVTQGSPMWYPCQEPMQRDPATIWYHGSPLELRTICVGSTITRNRDLARVFSHKPTVVSVSDNGEIHHNGTESGFLYEIAERVSEQDIEPHPRTTMAVGEEWLTKCELSVRKLGDTHPLPEEQLTEEEHEMIRAKQRH